MNFWTFLMQTQTPPKTKVVSDADVISHLIKGNKLDLLAKVFPGTLIIPRIVIDEVNRITAFKKVLADFILKYKIEIFETSNITSQDTDFMFEYIDLNKNLDKGESAVLALAKIYGYEVASSNTKDISQYCHDNNIKVYITEDILHEARGLGLIKTEEIDDFIELVVSKNSNLHYDSYKDYLSKKPAKT